VWETDQQHCVKDNVILEMGWENLDSPVQQIPFIAILALSWTLHIYKGVSVLEEM
jgi:hypothetical protein